MRYPLLNLALLSALLSASCGGNGLPSARNVVLSIDPPSASVASGGKLALTASATGFTGPTVVVWWIQESHDKDRYDDCGILSTQSLPTWDHCPYGYVVFSTVDGLPNQAEFHAPPTPGTYHVTVRAVQPVAFDSVTKFATSPITVTP